MTVIDALHGRSRVRRAKNLRRTVVALVLLAIPILTLEQLAQIDAGLAAAGRWSGSVWAGLLATLLACLGGVIGGLLIDRLGVKAVVGLVMIMWCGLAVLGAGSDPLVYLGLGQVVTRLMPGLMLAAVLVVARLSLAPCRRGLAVALLLTAYYTVYSHHVPSGLYMLLFDQPDPDVSTSWQYPMFALATVGAGLAAIWILTLPEVDAASGLDLRPPPPRPPAAMVENSVRLLRDPAVLSLVALQLCSAAVDVYALDQYWTLASLRYGTITRPMLIAVVVTPLTFLAMASWSDWIYRRTRSFLKARRPFVVVGFLLAVFAPLTPTSPRDEITFPLLAAIGIGALRIADLLIVDLAPRRLAGAFIGTIVSAQAALSVLVYVLNSVVMGRAALGEATVVCFAVAGAILAAVLMPLMRPEDDAQREQDAGIAGQF